MTETHHNSEIKAFLEDLSLWLCSWETSKDLNVYVFFNNTNFVLVEFSEKIKQSFQLWWVSFFGTSWMNNPLFIQTVSKSTTFLVVSCSTTFIVVSFSPTHFKVSHCLNQIMPPNPSSHSLPSFNRNLDSSDSGTTQQISLFQFCLSETNSSEK